ncbi:MAG: hypothetical protein ACRDT0_21460 [Pseudonocardiaceae bacterium]
MTERRPLTECDGQTVTVVWVEIVEDCEGLPLGVERHAERATVTMPHHGHDDEGDEEDG